MYQLSKMNLPKIPILNILLILTACGNRQIKTPEKAMTQFEEFLSKEKFQEDYNLFYPGLANPSLKTPLTKKINLIAKDFETLAAKGNATEKEYHNAIKKGLAQFSELELDTEDRERVCKYIEELMDIVGLESSGGHLNKFMYGFDL